MKSTMHRKGVALVTVVLVILTATAIALMSMKIVTGEIRMSSAFNYNRQATRAAHAVGMALEPIAQTNAEKTCSNQKVGAIRDSLAKGSFVGRYGYASHRPRPSRIFHRARQKTWCKTFHTRQWRHTEQNSTRRRFVATHIPRRYDRKLHAQSTTRRRILRWRRLLALRYECQRLRAHRKPSRYPRKRRRSILPAQRSQCPHFGLQTRIRYLRSSTPVV